MANVAHSTLTTSDLHEPKGISTASQGQVYIADGNGSGTWVDTGATIGASSATTGDLKPTLKSVADVGWIMADDGTIGDASSGGTTRANTDAEDLFKLLWNNFANTEAAVSGGRGVSASSDWAAHKNIALPKMLGRVYGVAGAGSGLTSRSLGVCVGDEGAALAEENLPAHIHGAGTLVVPSSSFGVSLSLAGTGGEPQVSRAIALNLNSSSVSISGSTGSVGSGTEVSLIQPTVFLNMMIKL